MNLDEKNIKEKFFDFSNTEISKDRSYFIDKSVKVEFLVNMLLANILGIKDPSKSKSFGDTTQSLSFIAKVTLLNDLEFIKNDVKIKLELFASIRNKFAHLFKADSFDTAISPSKLKELEKIYKSLKDNNQTDAFNKQVYVNQLIKDVEQSLENIIELLLEKLVTKASKGANIRIAERFYDLLSLDPRFISSRIYLKILYDKATKEVAQNIGAEDFMSMSAL
jgi:hypothetical protein